MEEEYTSKSLSDYIDAFRRRKLSISIIAGVVFTISLIIAVVWPPTYRSTATILIEEQEIPSDLVRSTITSYANQRIQIIKARVMTRKNLMEIIEKFSLYTKDRKYKTTEEILERMKNDIDVNTVNAEVIDPKSGRPGEATIAFTLSFKGENPGSVQKVANELTTLYLNENLRERTEKANETYAFLSSEAEKLNVKISEYESKLAEFKEKYSNVLPEMRENNVRGIERIEASLIDINSKISSLEERKFYLENQMAQIDPIGDIVSSSGYRSLDMATQIKSLERTLDTLSAKYTQDHPDIVRTKNEIAALKRSVAEKNENTNTNIENIEAQNPAYISIRAQLAGAMSELKALGSQKEELTKKILEYEKRLEIAPNIEKEYRLLLRDYNQATTRYQEIKSKQMAAEIGQEMEKERKGEKFSLIDPPQLPEEPVSPNRPAIIFLGFILSLAGGLGFAVLGEAMSSAVRGAKQVANIVGMAPLSVIPQMMNEYDVIKQIQIKKISIVTMALLFVIFLIMIHFAFSPLDVLWFRGMRKVDGIVGG